MQLRHILSPVDFSDLSGLALRYAAMLARCSGAQLTVAYANPFSPPPYFTATKLEEMKRQHRESFEDAQAALERFVLEQLGRAADARVLETLPVDAIRTLAGETAADLIVMGTHGRTGVNRLMLGSVAERVLRESDVPVLTVRATAANAAEPPRNILCPVNDTPAAREAILAAALVAGCFGGNVIALHVREGRPEREIGDLCAWVPEQARTHCRVIEETRDGDAATEIVSLASEQPCDLLVLGAQHRRFFDSTLLGSTVARVVRHAPCPVLTVMARPS